MRLEMPRGRKDLTAITESEGAELAGLAQSVHREWGDGG